VENQSLIDLRDQVVQSSGGDKTNRTLPSLTMTHEGINSGKKRVGRKAEGFQDMNAILAHLLVNLTASMRFPGDLNVDLNEITTNLVPYPRLHYLTSSLR